MLYTSFRFSFVLVCCDTLHECVVSLIPVSIICREHLICCYMSCVCVILCCLLLCVHFIVGVSICGGWLSCILACFATFVKLVCGCICLSWVVQVGLCVALCVSR